MRQKIAEVFSMETSSVFERHFILTTAAIVFVLGLPVYFNIAQTPKVQQKIDATKINDRTPASVVIKDQLLTSYHFSKSQSVESNCEDNQRIDQLKGSHLRLKGTSCGLNQNEIRIINQTNGFTASVIQTKNFTYTTDFIDLKEGLNNIEIVHLSDNKVLKTQKISVQRAPASDEEN